jgi:phenylacetate-coenzyme A ligase PaaK-like adenylate-forming protein
MNRVATPHLWQGEWIGDAELEARLAGLGDGLSRGFPERLALETLLGAADQLGSELRAGSSDADAGGEAGVRAELLACLRESGRFSESEALATLEELGEFLRRERLEAKVSRELFAGRLGSDRSDPFRLERIDYRSAVFEAWAPIGFLVHIAPTNAINVPFLSVIEGLLAGNVCFVKTGGSDSIFPQLCLKALVDRDSTGHLRRFVFAARISSRRQDLLKQLLAPADGIAVWGGEEALAGIRALAPAHARIIEWGPKISFAYVARDRLGSESLDGLARECCLMEQQACSSPQVVYAETEDFAELGRFAARLAQALERVSPEMPRQVPSLQERAEITKTVEVSRLEACLPGRSGQVIEARDGSWRVLVDPREGLRASPLFRTVWVKPLPRARILPVLRPLRHYLQTVGLSCGLESLGQLSDAFFRAGALRVTPLGSMVSGYMGEPHDGVYALQRYSRRVSVTAPEASGWAAIEAPAREARADALAGSVIAGLNRAAGGATETGQGRPVMDKEQFAAQAVDDRFSELFFKSGGSSGEPKLSVFTYDDYHAQMRAAAQGLYAAGLDPATDRCINLFFGGGLYGGFVSFFTILENLKAVQLPMGAHADLEFVGRMIVDKRVDTLLGMPSYLKGLFAANHELFKRYRGIRKIFYGGEHLSEAQCAYFEAEYGVELIRSAAYGSNDIGPMGYQCSQCEGSVHHLHEGLHRLEILDADRDEPVEGSEAGRLVFSSRVRKGQSLARYDVGDLGRWVEGACGCGRHAPRFELLGRQGDIFRCGGCFFNYRKFALILSEIPALAAAEFQLVISRADDVLGRELLELRFARGDGGSRSPGASEDAVRVACLEGCEELRESVLDEGAVEFAARAVEPASLERVASSGKLKRVIDRRLDAAAAPQAEPEEALS